jgi:hypothetical protein
MGGESFFDENYGSWYLVRQRTRGVWGASLFLTKITGRGI